MAAELKRNTETCVLLTSLFIMRSCLPPLELGIPISRSASVSDSSLDSISSRSLKTGRNSQLLEHLGTQYGHEWIRTLSMIASENVLKSAVFPSKMHWKVLKLSLKLHWKILKVSGNALKNVENVSENDPVTSWQTASMHLDNEFSDWMLVTNKNVPMSREIVY